MCFLPHLRSSIGSFLPLARGAVLCLCLAAAVGRAGPVQMSCQEIPLPAGAGEPLFVDIDGDGLSDLLVMDPVEKKLFNYHQRPDGFRSSPDQIIALPPDTAWVAACDMDAHPGLELLMSTASGLVYCRQNAGLFESERRVLVEAGQVFTNNDFPILTSPSTNKAGTNDSIPVIAAGRLVLWHRNSAYQWSPGPPLALDVTETALSVNDSNLWTMGSNPAHSLDVAQRFRAKPDAKRDDEPENEAMRKLMDDLKKNNRQMPPQLQRVDVDGDGREDLVLWQISSGVLGFKTDVYLFLRGASRQLPPRPTQVLHCRGVSIPIGSEDAWSPVHDLNGDGVCELVLLEPKPGVVSYSGLVETLLSRGLDCSLSIRSFHHGAFSDSPEASVPVTVILGDWGDMNEYPIGIQGDFNGDGRPDLLVRRSETQWNIYFSANDGRWFASQPSLTFHTPARGYFRDIKDLNGDGLSDIVWHEPEENRLSIFMAPPRPAKGGKP